MTVREQTIEKVKVARAARAAYAGPERRSFERDPSQDEFFKQLRAQLRTEISEDCRALRLVRSMA